MAWQLSYVVLYYSATYCYITLYCSYKHIKIYCVITHCNVVDYIVLHCVTEGHGPQRTVTQDSGQPEGRPQQRARTCDLLGSPDFQQPLSSPCLHPVLVAWISKVKWRASLHRWPLKTALQLHSPCRGVLVMLSSRPREIEQKAWVEPKRFGGKGTKTIKSKFQRCYHRQIPLLYGEEKWVGLLL